MVGHRFLAAFAVALLAGCAAAPVERAGVPAAAASQAAGYAAQMVGKPYRFGGSTPRGFDCSGLVQFSYRRAGVAVPRTTEAQWRASRPVPRRALRRGDLLFFDQEGKRNSHVGIYLGEGSFVHAPSSGKHVRVDRLDSRYWRAQLSQARRF